METIKGDALLIKFKSEDIIDSLQSGCIYMNSINKFRDIEKDGDDKVGDYLDGLMHIHNGYIIVEDEEPQVQKLDNVGLNTVYSNDYCYCFYGMNSSNYQERFTDEQKTKFSEMGDTALIILNYGEFIKRVLNEAKKQNYEVYGGFVRYYNPEIDSFNVESLIKKDGLKMISLLKRNKYLYQQEFRIVIHAPNESADFIKLNIGDISDISRKIEAKKILNAKILPSKNEDESEA